MNLSEFTPHSFAQLLLCLRRSSYIFRRHSPGNILFTVQINVVLRSLTRLHLFLLVVLFLETTPHSPCSSQRMQMTRLVQVGLHKIDNFMKCCNQATLCEWVSEWVNEMISFKPLIYIPSEVWRAYFLTQPLHEIGGGARCHDIVLH